MKAMTKRTGAILAIAVYATILLAAVGLFFGSAMRASAAGTNEGINYFYSELANSQKAERFYNAFATLNGNGSFKKNSVNFDLVENGVVNSDDIQAYVDNGSAKLPVAFGAGRDAYLMDNPDLFYIDIYGVSVSAGTQSGKYVAFLDTSRTDTLYLDKSANEAKITTAIAAYETKLNEIVNGAQTAGDTKAQIEYVNQYIIEHTEYSFGTEIKNGAHVTKDSAAYINTAYGALVNGEAICGGYAKAFKAVLDRLEIPCVCIQGYSMAAGTSSYQPHMWNAVKLDGVWYAVDVTWNDTANKPVRWLLVGDENISKDHIPDGVISSSGFELKYPAIKPYDYGVDTDKNGMDIQGEYFDSDDNTGKRLKLTVSYDGKGAKRLEESEKYLAVRIGDKQDDGNIQWSVWMNCVAAADTMFPSGFQYDDEKTTLHLHAGMEFIQFAIIDYAPDEGFGAMYPDKPEYGDNAGKPFYYAYKAENLSDEHISQPSVPYHNDGFGSYIPAPGASTVTPANTGALQVENTYNITIIYNDSLELAEGKTESDVTLNVSASRGNEDLEKYIDVSNFRWDGNKTISFTFTPSKMFIHNLAVFYFYPTNLVGVRSKKIPEPVEYTFKRKSVVCSKVFNDGRLYMNVFGEPKMLDTTDLSVTDFRDENGHYYAEKQRSQLLLVANKPTEPKTKEMNDALTSDLNENPIAKEDIVSTATYEISLQICGVVRTVPNGSYMQVAFGFPEGFNPDDAGTTFKIYHYKHDNRGNITGVEEIPVIITEYGLIAQVKSFSPFTVVQVKKSAVTAQIKSVYANVSGTGGTLTLQGTGKSGITAVEDSVTYTVQAEAGYQVDRVLLNGKPLGAEKYANGVLTLTKEELADSNTLEASFVNINVAADYVTKGITIKQPDTIVVKASDMLQAAQPSAPLPAETKNSKKTVLITVMVILGVVIAAAVVVTIIFCTKRKKQNAK